MTPKQFKQIRKDLKLTQLELAVKIGRKPRMVQNYELGSHGIPDIVELLMKTFRVSLPD